MGIRGVKENYGLGRLVTRLSDWSCELNRSTQHYSNQLIRQYFPLENRSVRLYSIRPSQGSVPSNQRSRTTLAVETPARRLSRWCCVDPLRPPRLPGYWTRYSGCFVPTAASG